MQVKTVEDTSATIQIRVTRRTNRTTSILKSSMCSRRNERQAYFNYWVFWCGAGSICYELNGSRVCSHGQIGIADVG